MGHLSLKNVLTESIDSKFNYNINVYNKAVYINFSGIDNTDGITISKSFGAKPNAKFKGTYWYSTPLGNSAPFVNGTILPKAYNYLLSTGKYNLPDYNIFKTEILQTALDVVSPTDRSEAKSRYEALLEHILTTLNKPETKAMVEKISRIGIDSHLSTDVFGHVLSQKNAIRSFASKPTATYVATRKQWRSFNRFIKDDATKIILFAKFGGTFNEKDAEDKLGVKRQDVANSLQMQHKFNIAGTSDKAGPSFYPVVYFDIENTYVIPGLPDTWSDQAGYVDNLKGSLNAAAEKALIDQGVGNIQPATGNTATPDVNQEKNKTIFARLFNYLKKGDEMNVDDFATKDPTSDNSVVSLLTAYFNNVLFSREHDLTKRRIKTQVGLAGILAIEDIGKQQLASILSQQDQAKLLSREDFIGVWDDIMRVEQIISKQQMPTNESEDLYENEMRLNSVDDLMGLFGLDSNSVDNNVTNESNEETFYDIFNTLSEQIKRFKELI